MFEYFCLLQISEYSKENVCFVMFVDEQTLSKLSSEGNTPDDSGHVGLWKIVIMRNLPYKDMRKTGKVPKFLSHRLFPSSRYSTPCSSLLLVLPVVNWEVFLMFRFFWRYSIWLDSKMRLQTDPMLIIEYFLWRTKSEYAISNHYDRHCVWEEVLQNKRLNKYNHTAIDEQFTLYQSDGLTKFDPSDPNTPLPSCACHWHLCSLWRLSFPFICNSSLCERHVLIWCVIYLADVPEGSFIVRAHTPMSNLFSCLWFNEVDRFTSRDQLSFAYTYLKLRRMNPDRPFHLHMFKVVHSLKEISIYFCWWLRCICLRSFIISALIDIFFRELWPK